MQSTNFIKFISSTQKVYRIASRKISAYGFSQLWVAILFIALPIMIVSVQSYAEIPNSVQVNRLEGNKKQDVQIHKDSQANAQKVLALQKQDWNIYRGGNLSVPTDGTTSAYLTFSGAKDLIGLLVQTRAMKLANERPIQYDFPCKFYGQFIMAWKAGGKSCGSKDEPKNGGIIIPLNKKYLFPGIGNKSEQNSGKQDSDRKSSGELVVNPGEGQVVIRTNIVGSADITDYIENCVSIKTQSGSPIRLQAGPQGPPVVGTEHTDTQCTKEPKTTPSDVVSIEVLEGDILAKSKEKPEGELIKKGQKYSYPDRSVESIDASAEANSCEILRFLNPVYWSSPETPKSISDQIAEQLKQHREALGVSGRPPRNLSKLEEGILDEMNRARANPAAYADFIEAHKEYFHNNFLKLPGEAVDLNRRVDAVKNAISFLRSQRPLPPFSISEGMSRANQDHVKNQGASGKSFGHTDDNSTRSRNYIGSGARLSRYGSVGCVRYDEDEFENIVYFDKSTDQGVVLISQAVVMEMLIDYRPRRTGKSENFFNQDFQVTGVACGSHGKFLREMCVVTYAEGYLEKS